MFKYLKYSYLKAYFRMGKWTLKYLAKSAEMRYWKLRYTLLKKYGNGK